jgi:hypothetical protein
MTADFADATDGDDLDKTKARVLLINDAEDHANPPELGTVERAMKRVERGRDVLIPAGPDTHGRFMTSLGPPQRAAAAE